MATVDLDNKYTSVLLIICTVFLISNGLLLHGATLNSTSNGQRNQNTRSLSPKSSQYKNITAKSVPLPENSTEPDEMIHFVEKPTKNESLSNKIFQSKLQNRYVPLLDEACSKNNATYCKGIKNYPKSIINNLIRKNEVPVNAFSNEEADTLGTRIGGQGDQDYLCQSHIEVIYPEVAKTKTDQWKYVIQGTEQDTNIWKQGIQVETCGPAENKPCLLIQEVLPNGYHAYCEQKYLYRKLYALDHNGQPNYEDFKIPSCCQCVAHS